MKESCQELEISKIELTKFRSITNEGRFLSTNEELQLYTSFTQGHLEKNVKNTNTKDNGKQLQKQLFQKGKCKKQSIQPTRDQVFLSLIMLIKMKGQSRTT